MIANLYLVHAWFFGAFGMPLQVLFSSLGTVPAQVAGPTPALVPMSACIPVNGNLTGRIGPSITNLSGAFGGILAPFAIAMTVILAIIAISMVATRDGDRWMKRMFMPFAVLVGVAILIFLGVAVFRMANNMC